MKFNTNTNSNMLNSMVMSNFFDLDWKYPLWRVLKKNNQSYQFLLKFPTSTNSNTLNSKAMFTIFCFRLDILFWANLSKKLKLPAQNEIKN